RKRKSSSARAGDGPSGRPSFFRQEVLNRRRDDERQDHRDQDAANHRDGQRLQHLRSGAERERERQHPGHRRKRRHDDRTEPPPPRLNRRFLGGKSNRPKFLVGVQQQNPVLRDDADHHDEAHERRDVEGRSGDEQGEEHPGRRQNGRRKNRYRRSKRSKFEEQHQKNE